MKYENPWVDPRVQTVRVAAVRAYLADKGWRLKSFPRPQVLLFEGPLDDDGQPIRQVVPAVERGSDYASCIADLITNLARIEDRYAVDVLNDILEQAPALSSSARVGRDSKAAPATAAKKTRRAS